MFYVITKLNPNGPPTFLTNEELDPMPFSTENEDHDVAGDQPLCKAHGYAVLDLNNWELTL